VVADLDRHRHVQRLYPAAGGFEFAVPRAHRKVAGDRHRRGTLGCDLLHYPVERSVVLKPEMNVRYMKQVRFVGHNRIR